MLLDRHRPSHRWYHGGRYGFTGPYPEVPVPGGTDAEPMPSRTRIRTSPYIHALGQRPTLRRWRILLRDRTGGRARDPRRRGDPRSRTRGRARGVRRESRDTAPTGCPTIEPDGPVAEHLRPAETVVDVRPSSVVSRHLRGDGTDDFAGSLYLTSQRLILVGHTPFEVELDQIDELALAGERLLVTLADGTGLSIDAARPRLLRVQIAAALTAGR